MACGSFGGACAMGWSRKIGQRKKKGHGLLVEGTVKLRQAAAYGRQRAF